MNKGKIGEYACNSCGRKWYSGNYDNNSYQLCKACKGNLKFPPNPLRSTKGAHLNSNWRSQGVRGITSPF